MNVKSRPTTLLLAAALAAITHAGFAQMLEPNERFLPVPIRAVHLTDAFWLPRIETLQEKTIAYALEKCEREGRLENFLIAGGKMEGETRGRMPFDDTDVYKIIEGASASLLSRPDPALEKRLDDIIAIIAVGQEKDGYLTTWRTIDGMKPPAHWVNPGQRWDHLAASHELYNAGHLFEAASVHHAATGKDNLLNIATGYADLLVATFGPGRLERVPGHQIVETGLLKLYRITGRESYRDLARYFLDSRGNPEHHELFGAYSQDHVPVTQQTEVVGHAVRAVYMYAGMTDIAELYRDEAYFEAANALWHNMVERKLYITGGLGARHEGESFGDNYELPNLSAYAETCAAIGSVMWNQRLFQNTGDKDFYDVIERTLYNGTLSGLSLDGTHFFYANCLEADRHFAFNQGHHTRAEWFDCSCCPTNLIRFLPTVPGLIYSQQNNAVVVNLYASSEVEIETPGATIALKQHTHYPWDGAVTIEVSPKSTAAFPVKLRIPGWALNEPVPGGLYRYVHDADSAITIAINGQAVPSGIADGFITLDRTWSAGDRIELDLPMPVRLVQADEHVEALRGLVAVERGPLVYCFEETDNPVAIADIALATGAAFTPAKSDILGGITVLNGTTADGRTVTAIPYYAWSNRGVTSMKVWVPAKTD